MEYSNPYKQIANRKINKLRFIKKDLNFSKEIILLKGEDLILYDIFIQKPSIFRIKLHNNIENRKKIYEYLNLLCDIYTKIGEKNINRSKYFQNPDKNTELLFELLKKTREEFIKYIVLNRIKGNGNGPLNGYSNNSNRYLEEIIDEANNNNTYLNLPIEPDNDISIINLPKAPNHNPYVKNKIGFI